MKIPKFPVVLVGKKFWGPLLDWIKDTMLREEKISKEDLDLYVVVDTAEEAMDYILKCHKKGIHSTVRNI